jgi:sugar/nucleoside kinase (ribokinase family)
MWRENVNTQSASTDSIPTGHYMYMFEERGEKKIYPNNNRDPYKEEIKIPPPHPHKRKKIDCFSHSKDPYFLFPPE